MSTPSARPSSAARPLAAVLWDMDGLLIDSEPLWTIAETELAASLGGTWTAAIKASCIGKRLDASVPLMLRGLGVDVDPGSVQSAEAFLLHRMAQLFSAKLPVLPGALRLLAECREAGVQCALVSSSYRVLVDACLGSLDGRASAGGVSPGGSSGLFTVSLAGDEVDEAKPSPRPYLLAAAALGVHPTDCVVLEDSATGAAAGVAAGCVTVLVPGDSVQAPEVDLGWTRVQSLAELSLAALQTRMAINP